MKSSRLRTLALLSLGLGMCACTETLREQPSAADMESYAQEAKQEYIIGPRDLLQISVWRQPELSVPVEVRHDGKISVPLLDDVQAAELTPTELKAVVTERLEEYVTEPNVTVVVVGAANSEDQYREVVGRQDLETTQNIGQAVHREPRAPASHERKYWIAPAVISVLAVTAWA